MAHDAGVEPMGKLLLGTDTFNIGPDILVQMAPDAEAMGS
jgi:hypothetical protein